jgi:hypothetical protein
MSAVYEKLGVRFIYPEGWKVTEDEKNEQPRTISLESPAGGTWELLLYQDGSTPNELAADVLSTMKEEYEEIETSPWTSRFDDVDVVGYDMYFYYLDLLIHGRTLAGRLGSQTAILIWQAEDRTFAELESVFQAITTCLLNPQKYAAVE